MAATQELINEIPETIENPFPDYQNMPAENLPDNYYNNLKEQRKTESEELKKLAEDLKNLATNPNIEQFLLEEIHKTVSAHDDHVIKADFYTAISAYLSPINLALKCESGSGKTYGTVQTVKFLPPEDVQMIGSQSPKVISHENGILLDKTGKIIPDPPNKPRKDDYGDKQDYQNAYNNYNQEIKAYQEQLKDSYYQVFLNNKIFTFLESVNIETFKMIKSTLSHDNETIDHKYVDDHGKVHITRLVGYPACIFNSLDNEFMSEFATRTLTATPTTTGPKIEASKEISNKKTAYPFLYPKTSYNKHLIQEYIRQIRGTIKKGNLKIIVPFPTIHQKFRSLEVRDMRDFNHFLELVPAFTAFKLYQRPIITINKENYLVSTIQDVLDAKALFDSIIMTTKTSTEQKILTFYYQCVKNKVNGSTVNVLTDIYNKKNKKVSTRTVQRWLDRLTDIEWVDRREGVQLDKREVTYYPLQAINKDQNQTQFDESNDESSDIPTKDKNMMALDLTVFCQKDYELWRNIMQTTSSATRHLLLKINGQAKKLTQEEVEKIILADVNPHVVYYQTTPESTPKHETKPESNAIQKMSIDDMSLDSNIDKLQKNDYSTIASCTLLPKTEWNKDAKCPSCKFGSRTLNHQIQFFNKTTCTICSACGAQIQNYLNNNLESEKNE